MVLDRPIHVLVRVWLPDRPGALGNVAARIGSVRGDIVGVDILEREGGVAIDEFAVDLPSSEMLPLLLREIEQVEGASVEELSVVDRFPDPRLDALTGALRLCSAVDLTSLWEALVDQVHVEFGVDWVALASGSTVLATAGTSVPGGERLDALTLGLSASPAVAGGHGGPGDIALAQLARQGAALLVGRQGHPFRQRERAQLGGLAAIADQTWFLLTSRATSGPPESLAAAASAGESA